MIKVVYAAMWYQKNFDNNGFTFPCSLGYHQNTRDSQNEEVIAGKDHRAT